jgi:hypothetical protein
MSHLRFVADRALAGSSSGGGVGRGAQGKHCHSTVLQMMGPCASEPQSGIETGVENEGVCGAAHEPAPWVVPQMVPELPAQPPALVYPSELQICSAWYWPPPGILSEIQAWVQSAVQTTHFAMLSGSVPVVQGAGGAALPVRQLHTPEEQIGAPTGQTF